MKLLKFIQSHLNIKLLLAFVLIIFVFTLVLIAAVELILPRAFERHLLFMGSIIEDQGDALEAHDLNLYDSYRSAIYESLLFAIPLSLAFAIVLSIIFSREFVRPIRELSSISREISDGNYSRRIALPKELTIEEMDEVKQLAINFNQMAAKLENTENLRRQLIGDVSHELRTPIALIKASLEGLIDGILKPSNKTFKQMEDEADRMAKLVNDLQELSILESGAYEINRQKLDINQTINATLALISTRFATKKIKIKKSLQRSGAFAYYDPDRVKQVLTNILENAYQYSRKGGTVTIQTTNNDHEILVSIKDNGRGIRKEDLPHIFTRFFRADKSRSRKSGGSGIGLTITKQLVEAHGGRIWAESGGENKGTSITFTLPRTK